MFCGPAATRTERWQSVGPVNLPWPPNPESPPVFDQVWTTTDGLNWTQGQIQPVLPESIGSTWAGAGIDDAHGPYAVGPFGLITVTIPADAPDARRLWFTPDGVTSTSFDVFELFGPDSVADSFAVGSDSVVALISTFDESADYPWTGKVWAGVPSGP